VASLDRETVSGGVHASHSRTSRRDAETAVDADRHSAAQADRHSAAQDMGGMGRVHASQGCHCDVDVTRQEYESEGDRQGVDQGRWAYASAGIRAGLDETYLREAGIAIAEWGPLGTHGLEGRCVEDSEEGEERRQPDE
jgi:hypothetical protein